MKKLYINTAFRIAFTYLIISLLWIFFSDSLVAQLSPNTNVLNFLQTIKGWFFVVVTALLIYYFINKKIQREKALRKSVQKQKEKMETILQQSPNPTIVFNENGEVILLNQVLLNRTGYSYEEVNTLEKWIQKAHKDRASEIHKLVESLFDIKEPVDNGTFEIYTKNNDVMMWHFNTAPFGILDGKRTMISQAIDITELEEKKQLIVQQSKMAAIGEMIENIAHQWRQPLNNISTLSTGMQLKKDVGDLSDEYLIDSLQTINDNAQYLSHTIDDFRNFFRQEKAVKVFDVSGSIEKALSLLKYKLQDMHVVVIKDFEPVEISSFENEFIQVLLNLFNNTIDAFTSQPHQKRVIKLKCIKQNNKVKVIYIDSAGGIKDTIIGKIFEPYFTTKHQTQGTGIGLYMTEQIITHHMNGSILVGNAVINYENEELKGARFTISLPID